MDLTATSQKHKKDQQLSAHEREFEWVIIFLIYADFRKDKEKIESQLHSMCEDIRNCQLNKQNKIIIIYNRLFNKGTNLQDKTYLFEVLPASSTPKVSNSFKLRKTLARRDVTKDAKKLSEVFEVVNEKYKGRKHLVIAWDHGAIFGIFKEPIESNVRRIIETDKLEKKVAKDYIIWIRRNKPFIIRKRRNIFLRLMEGPEENTEFREILTNEELASAITKGFDKKKIDVFVMVNCYMQNIISQYALRKCVEYFVAPEGIINEPGYNYPIMLATLMSNPETTGEDLAKLSVTSLKDNHRNRNDFKKNIDEWAVLAIRLNYLNDKEKINLIDQLSFELKKLLNAVPEENWNKMHDGRNECFPFDEGISEHMVDLLSCIFFLSKIFKNLRDKKFTERIEQIINEIRIGEHIGANVYPPKFTNNKKPSGLAIYFPEDNAHATSDLDTFPDFISEKGRMRPGFFKKTKWYSFLKKYLKV